MNCDRELLQAFLDGELNAGEGVNMKNHLAECRACRQELSRLRLLWYELEQVEEIPIPAELPFLRQQVISAGLSLAQQAEKKVTFWETQKMAWQPMALIVTAMPGAEAVSSAAKSVGARSLTALGSLGKKGLQAVWRGRNQ